MMNINRAGSAYRTGISTRPARAVIAELHRMGDVADTDIALR